MSLNEALNLFGLGENYIEEELNQAYRRMLLLYHPDNNIGKSEEEQQDFTKMMLKINDAYKILKEHLDYRTGKNNTLKDSNNEIVQKLYEMIIEKSSRSLAKLNPSTKRDEINDILNMLKTIVELFEKYELGLISIVSLMLLEKISFDNELEDLEIIKSVKRNSTIVNSTRLYIKINPDNNLNSNLKKLEYRDGIYYLIYPDISSKVEEEIPKEKLMTEYIYLDDFISNAEQFKVRCLLNGNTVEFLYRYNGIYLGLLNGEFAFFPEVRVSKIEMLKNEDYAIYQDREAVNGMIVEWFNGKLNKIDVIDKPFIGN